MPFVCLFYLGFNMAFNTLCHITTGSFMGRGNQYIQLVKFLYCKLPTNGKQLPAFILEVGPGFELPSRGWEWRMLPLCHPPSPPPPPQKKKKKKKKKPFVLKRLYCITLQFCAGYICAQN